MLIVPSVACTLSASAGRDIFEGSATPPADVVCLNAECESWAGYIDETRPENFGSDGIWISGRVTRNDIMANGAIRMNVVADDGTQYELVRTAAWAHGRATTWDPGQVVYIFFPSPEETRDALEQHGSR